MRSALGFSACLLLAAAGCATSADGDAPNEGSPTNPTNPTAPATPGDAPTERIAPPEQSACEPHDDPPILTPSIGLVSGAPATEVHGGLPKTEIDAPTDHILMGLPPLEPARTSKRPASGCGLDTDGDGWLDGDCNERRLLYVDKIVANHTQELFHDEVYFVADDVRHPNDDGLHGTWEIADHGGVVTPSHLLAERVRPGSAPTAPLALVSLELWEDDWDPLGQWIYDDYFGTVTVDLSQYADGETFTRNITGDGYDYDVTFRVKVEQFADPNPNSANGDSDHDGIGEANEAKLALKYGGIVDPTRADVLVEVDWMPGHELRTEAKRQVVTQLYRHGIQLTVMRDEQIPEDNCLTVPEARALYNTYFTHRAENAFRYAIIGEKIWNNASGVQWGDIFLVNDATWWINNWVLPQAGTFIHELGHTLGLTKEMFHMVDSISWLSYESAMNYTYQAVNVDYSSTGDGQGENGDDHDDWAVVNPGYALQFTFAAVTDNSTGVCQ